MDYVTYRTIVHSSKSIPCKDCGELKRGQMTFDHIPSRGKKNFTIGSIHKWRYLEISEEELRKEIALCEVVCRPCHDIREAWRIAFGGFEVMQVLAEIQENKPTDIQSLIGELLLCKRWAIGSITQPFRVMSWLITYDQNKQFNSEEKRRRRILSDWAISFARGCAYLRMKEKHEGLCSNSE